MKVVGSGTVALLAVSLAAESVAQERGPALEEVVVTARQREENLMEVPLSISAFTSADVEARGMKSIQDVAGFAPSFHFEQGTGGGSGRNDRSARQLTFRGLSVAPGLLFIDGSQVHGNNPPPMEDVERIEVLPGPQSVYFGRATFSGALNYVMREPGEEFAGRVTAEVGNYGSNEGSLSIEGALNEKKSVLGRVTLSHRFKGGQYSNYGDLSEVFGDEKTDSISTTLVFHPSDGLKIKFWGSYYEDLDGPPASYSFKTDEMNCDLGGSRGLWFCGTLPDYSEIDRALVSGNSVIDATVRRYLIDNELGFLTRFDPYFHTDNGMRRKGMQGDIRIDYTTEGGYNFTSLTAYHESRRQLFYDMVMRDGRVLENPWYGVAPGAILPYPTWLILSQEEGHTFSQELRLASPSDRRLRWIVGTQYTAWETGSLLYTLKTTGVASSGTPTISSPRTLSAFGGVTFDLTQEVSLTAEARYQSDRIKSIRDGSSSGFPLDTPIIFRETYNSFAPRVVLDYKPTDRSTMFALWSRGYQPGGFNTALLNQPKSVMDQLASVGVNSAYGEEIIDNYEIGWKTTFWDYRARASLTYYYAQWRDGQVSTTVPFFAPDGQLNLLAVTQNLGAIDLDGFEFQGDVAVTDNFQISATLSYNDSEIKEYICGDCMSIYGDTDARGNRLGDAAKVKYSLSGQYRNHLAGDYEWFARLDYTHRGSFFLTSANVAKAPARDVVNLRIGVENDRMTLVGYVTNLFDDDGLQGHLGVDILTLTPTNSNLQNEIRGKLPERRRFGIRATYHF